MIPKNILAAENAEDLMAHYWMDVYLWGRISDRSHEFLERTGDRASGEPGDMELLRSAKPGFLRDQYYPKPPLTPSNPLDRWCRALVK